MQLSKLTQAGTSENLKLVTLRYRHSGPLSVEWPRLEKLLGRMKDMADARADAWSLYRAQLGGVPLTMCYCCTKTYAGPRNLNYGTKKHLEDCIVPGLGTAA